MSVFVTMRKQKCKLNHLITLALIAVIAATMLTACGQEKGTTITSGGLTSIEAEQLGWSEAKKVFKDSVLWRIAPIKESDSATMSLDTDWQNNDRSSAWFIWYADASGEDWFMESIQGKKIASKDIGTRSFSAMTMPSSWPRQSTAISMKDAALAAKAQGANLNSITWIEFTCDYENSDFRSRPLWVFACSEPLDAGGTLDYRVFVDALTGAVAGAINDRDERMALPIDIEALQKPRTVNHEEDLRQFFSFIEKGDPISAVRQLAYEASPNDATASQWLANFQSLKSLKVVSVEQVNLEQWTDEWESYKVVLDVTTSELPEKYGWENGENFRWVTLIPQGGGAWKVASLAQGP
jgi:hypothetical protein